MALLFGLIGVLGVLTSGKLADRLSGKGFQYSVWMIVVAQLIAIPFYISAFLVSELKLAIALFIIPAFVGSFFAGPSLALIQTLSPVHMRAVSAAVFMLCLNLIGLGLGPLLVGVASDVLTPVFGDAALNISLSSFSVLLAWSAWHYYLCGKALKANPPLS